MSNEIAGDYSIEAAFVLNSEHEESLLTAMTEGDRGEVITGEELVDRLRCSI